MIGCLVGYVYALIKDGVLSSRALTRRGYDRGIRLISVASIEKLLSQETVVSPQNSSSSRAQASNA
jgi:hypothetical protein